MPALAIAVAACGSSGSPSSRTTPRSSVSPAPSGPRLSGTVETTEAVRLSTAFTAPLQVLVHQSATPAPAGTTCATYAAGSDGTFVAPQFDVENDNHSLYFSGMVASGYVGPGVYHSDTTPSLGGTISVGVGAAAGQQPAFTILRSRVSGSSTLTVNPGGSGSFEFSEWGSDEVRGNTGSAASISGTVTWTCG